MRRASAWRRPGAWRSPVPGWRSGDIDEAQLAKARAELGGDTHTEALDLTDAEAVATAHERTAARLGPIDILVTSAGIAGATKPVAEYSVEEWRRVIDVDLNAVVLCCRAVVPGMVGNN